MPSTRSFEIQRILGRGGFGTVYHARMRTEGGLVRQVALKVLNPDVEGIDEIARRMRDEARMLALVRHRAVVHVDDLVEVDGRKAMVMEYVDGVDLKNILAANRLPPGPALTIVSEVAGALHAAYSSLGPQGQPLRILHRDIKPANVILTQAGEVKVLDFGIARGDFDDREAHTRSVLFGSPEYMAPERLDGIEGPAGDIYSLGTLLFEMIYGYRFGKVSANRERYAERMRAFDDLAATSLVLHEDLLGLLKSLLAFEPEARPSAREVERICDRMRALYAEPSLREWAESAVPASREFQDTPIHDSDLRGELSAFSGSSVFQRSEAPVASSPKVRSGLPTILLAGGLASILLLAGAVLLWYLLRPAPPEPPRIVEAPIATPPPAPAATAPPTPTPEAPQIQATQSPKQAKPAPPPKTEAAPVKVVESAPAPAPASVGFTGALSVALSGEGRRLALPAKVPAGSYAILAVFAGAGEVKAGQLLVHEGSTIHLNCNEKFKVCKPGGSP